MPQVNMRLGRFATSEGLYFTSYGLFLTTSLLSASFYYQYFIGTAYTWLQVACLVLLLIREYRLGLGKQNIPALVVLGLLAVFSLQSTVGNLTRLVPMMFFYIYGARNIHFDRIARFSLHLSATVVALVVFSGYLGIIDNVVVAKSGRVREYLGFRYALYLPGILLNMTALWAYLHREDITIPKAMFWKLLNGFVYLRTDSRISFALALLVLIGAWILRYVPLVKKPKALWGLLSGSYLISAAFSFVFTGIYDGAIPWLRRLNSMLESRLSLGKRSLEDHGFGLLGQKITWVGNGLDAFGNSVEGPYTYVDCLYVKLLQRYGGLFVAAFLGLVTWAMAKLQKQGHHLLLLICATVAAHCILDDLSFALHYNTFWIALGLALMAPETLKTNSRG